VSDPRASHPTRALVHLDRLAHNLRLLRELVGGRPLWPAIKADAYGHGALRVARELVAQGCDTLCVAHAEEALELREAGVRATFVLLSAALPEQSDCIALHGFEPVVCGAESLEALARAAERTGRRLPIHVMVDTGMGRIGVRPDAAPAFLARCRAHASLRVRGLASHFARADEGDPAFSREQLAAFERVREATSDLGVEVCHFANSAAIFDLPESHLDAARPGIALYGLRPSPRIVNPRVDELRPVLEWRSRISFLKEVPAGLGLSYGHTFRTRRPTLVATLPVGYGDGLRRNLSNGFEVWVGGTRCPQVGTITMDQTLVDVTALRGRVATGDDAVLLGGGAGGEQAAAPSADEWAARLGTINYEIVTAITRRVPRVAVGGAASED
jgi:alanine racemase